MARENKMGPEMQTLRVLLKKQEITLEDLQNLRAEHPKVFGQLDDREELEALCADNLSANDNLRAQHLIENIVDAAYWHGYDIGGKDSEGEINDDN